MELRDIHIALSEFHVPVHQRQSVMDGLDQVVVNLFRDLIPRQVHGSCGRIFSHSRIEISLFDISLIVCGNGICELTVGGVQGMERCLADTPVPALDELSISRVGHIHQLPVFILHRLKFQIRVVEQGKHR